MAETDKLLNEDSSMAGAKPTNPTAAPKNPIPAATTRKTIKVYDTETGRYLEFVPYADMKNLLEDTIAKQEQMDEVIKAFLKILNMKLTIRIEIKLYNRIYCQNKTLGTKTFMEKRKCTLPLLALTKTQ